MLRSSEPEDHCAICWRPLQSTAASMKSQRPTVIAFTQCILFSRAFLNKWSRGNQIFKNIFVYSKRRHLSDNFINWDFFFFGHAILSTLEVRFQGRNRSNGGFVVTLSIWYQRGISNTAGWEIVCGFFFFFILEFGDSLYNKFWFYVLSNLDFPTFYWVSNELILVCECIFFFTIKK